MSREIYYYVFTYVDGSNQEFEVDNDALSAKVLNSANKRIQVDNVIINLENIIKVTVETKSQRDEKTRLADENHKKNLDAISKIKF